MNPKTVRTIVFAGGGSAGHVEPALAVARQWRAIYPGDRSVFIGTLEGLENSLVPAAGFELRRIPKVVLPRSLNADFLRLPWNLWKAVAEARVIISRSSLVVGFGGYVSASAYLAARLEKVPIVVHEANATIGWANRLGAILTDYLAIARPVQKGKFSKANVTGLPLRQDVHAAVESASSDWEEARIQAKHRLGWDVDRPTLLVLGGSQGSASINREVAVAIPYLTSHGVQILHSVGAKNPLPESIPNYTPTPYIIDMATAYLAADLIIARSGAVTCAETGALGRMAIFIPLPIGNGEQARNADYLVAAGRAIVISQREFSANWLTANFDTLIARARKTSMKGLSRDLGAADNIVGLMQRALSEKRP
ncbi:MAG TPA: UDP-N-acetylglucosamine--N-acetylmuramyl-(pentapeptide) pyrophosphoryl-undecaprenol N-acetylglucosamine transferase [Candidatus Nanopelagicaceae bacterium]